MLLAKYEKLRLIQVFTREISNAENCAGTLYLCQCISPTVEKRRFLTVCSMRDFLIVVLIDIVDCLKVGRVST
jgi:hypothetical protein